MKYSQVLVKLAIDIQPNAEPFKIGDLVLFKDSFATMGSIPELMVVTDPDVKMDQEPDGFARTRQQPVPINIPNVSVAMYHTVRALHYSNVEPEVRIVESNRLRLATPEEIDNIDTLVSRAAKDRVKEKISGIFASDLFATRDANLDRFDAVKEFDIDFEPQIARKVTKEPVLATTEQIIQEALGSLDRVAFYDAAKRVAKIERNRVLSGAKVEVIEDIPPVVELINNGVNLAMLVICRPKIKGKSTIHQLYVTETPNRVELPKGLYADVTVVYRNIHGNYEVAVYAD